MPWEVYCCGTFSDEGRLGMGRFVSGKFWAMVPLVSGTFDGTFWEWDV